MLYTRYSEQHTAVADFYRIPITNYVICVSAGKHSAFASILKV